MKSSIPSTRKKVVIRKLDKGLVKGYINPGTYLTSTAVEILDRDGRLVTIPLEELKGVFFVRDFEGNPRRPERRIFHSRPKHSGLWIRMTFRDNEVLEGIIPNSLLDLDPQGFVVTPPDMYSNNLKVFVPRNALSELVVLGAISDGAARRASDRGSKARGKATDDSAQIGLFPGSNPPEPK